MPIANSIAANAEQLAAWRRDLHQHPEIGFEEHRTSKVVADKLRSFGFDDVQEGIGQTGLVGVLHGRGGPGDEANAIMLRADMDALPILEETGAEHASVNAGVMHACGHDGHTTMLLGAAQHLAETRAFSGTVYFCFQPAEENGGGADMMIKDGLFDRFPCRAIYGMHNMPGAAVGTFLTNVGPILAACDEFEIKLTGLGGHAAQPQDTRDTITAAAALVQSLQTISARRIAPIDPCVVSVTQIHGGSANNVIPQDVVLGGTVRAFEQSVYDKVYEEINRIVDNVCAAYEVTAEVTGGMVYYPPTANDPKETAFCLDVAREVAGPDAVRDDLDKTMGAEDFAFYALEKPACFIMCGNGDSAGLHHPKYDFDDAASPWGASFWARLVERALP
ncbi:UNVERIFIED_CONTAM: hypothetical protein GTU68_028038 [Idotea baltica]|nr:hypothetical protein [Idotea baltica]